MVRKSGILELCGKMGGPVSRVRAMRPPPAPARPPLPEVPVAGLKDIYAEQEIRYAMAYYRAEKLLCTVEEKRIDNSSDDTGKPQVMLKPEEERCHNKGCPCEGTERDLHKVTINYISYYK